MSLTWTKTLFYNLSKFQICLVCFKSLGVSMDLEPMSTKLQG